METPLVYSRLPQSFGQVSYGYPDAPAKGFLERLARAGRGQTCLLINARHGAPLVAVSGANVTVFDPRPSPALVLACDVTGTKLVKKMPKAQFDLIYIDSPNAQVKLPNLVNVLKDNPQATVLLHNYHRLTPNDMTLSTLIEHLSNRQSFIYDAKAEGQFAQRGLLVSKPPAVSTPLKVVPPVEDLTPTEPDTTTPPEDDLRAREDDGTFKADDPTTPDIDEAWKSGVAPAKKTARKRAAKKTASKRTAKKTSAKKQTPEKD